MKKLIGLPKAILVCILVVLVAGGVLGARALHRQDGGIPVVIEMQPSNPGANTTVSMRVTVNQASSNPLEIAIGCTSTTAFVDLPSTVTVPAGETSVSWNSTTSSTFQGWEVVTATANGGSALNVFGN